MEAMNINHVEKQSNYRLRGEPVRLLAKKLVGSRPCGDGWEEVWDESSEDLRYRPTIRLNPGRKQRAARLAVPINTVIKKIPLHIQPKDVVEVVLSGGSEQDIKIARLSAKIKEMMGIIRDKRTNTRS